MASPIDMAAVEDVQEVVVVGGGVEGSATAYHLAKTGHRTLLLEQFPLPHTRGSSHGQSRIIRKAYTEDYYAAMATGACTKWSQLEKETGSTIYKRSGLLMIGEEGGQILSDTETALTKTHSDYVKLTPNQMKTRYTMMTFDPTLGAILDPSAGILHADKCVAQLQAMFKKNGGRLHDAEKVLDIQPGELVTVTTNKGVYKTKSLVLAAGSWTSKLIKPLGLNLPLEPVRATVLYWKQRGDPSRHDIRHMPLFIAHECNKTGTGNEFYGLPANEYPDHVKICNHRGPRIDPESRDVETSVGWDVDATQAFVKQHFPDLEEEPSIMERCIYTMTPDEDFILDTHPHWKNIVIGAGFSGHGFKMAPVVGQILAELALHEPPSYNLTPFRINRFSAKAKL